MKSLMKSYIQKARWFGGKGRDFEVTGMRRLTLPVDADIDDGPDRTVVVELVSLAYADGGTDVYQVPVSYCSEEQAHLPHALIGHWTDETLGDVWAYDALHDHAAAPRWLHGFARAASSDDLVFHRIGEADLDLEARSSLLSGEQSNSSVAFGDDSLMKLFRRVTSGSNPDIEILAALTAAGNENIAPLHGWVETTDDEPLQLGILQQFLRTASDGFELALASLRDLYSDLDVHPRDAGGDFAAEAERLGVAVAGMHVSLAEAFPTEALTRSQVAALADAMSDRLDAAVVAVPELVEHASALHAIFDAVRHVDHPVTVQRVHGDLHLGQTLRTVKNWKIIDFEGEPAKPLEERRRPDSPWRDVAGMLRSFDYAAEIARRDHDTDAESDVLAEARAQEWSARNRTAFLSGYQEQSAIEVDLALLDAYIADKAVYEAVYEARNRPAWLGIPLAALARLVAPSDAPVPPPPDLND